MNVDISPDAPATWPLTCSVTSATVPIAGGEAKAVTSGFGVGHAAPVQSGWEVDWNLRAIARRGQHLGDSSRCTGEQGAKSGLPGHPGSRSDYSTRQHGRRTEMSHCRAQALHLAPFRGGG